MFFSLTLCSFVLDHRMVRLSVDDLVAEAVDAFKNNECIEESPEEPAILVRLSLRIVYQNVVLVHSYV